MNLFATQPVRLQPYFGFRSATRLVLRARALRSHKARFGEGRRSTLRTMLEQFISHEAAGVAVTLEVASDDRVILSTERVTDGEGFVLFDVALDPQWDLPPVTVWESVRLHWVNSEGPQNVEAQVLVPGENANLAVISDIDDTIIETGITSGLKSVARNWKRVLAQLPADRTIVPGAEVFYSALGGGQVLPEGDKRAGKRVPATWRPFFYVSSSPWNLFSYIVAFQQTKNLPLGPIMMRDWGLNRETFGSASHGMHKSGAIDDILETFPDMRFALIGDDTQGDLAAFSHVVTANPGRIAAVFIRTAANEELNPEEQAGQRAIEQAGVPLWLGHAYALGENFLRELGFTPGGETEEIVRAVEDLEPSHANPHSRPGG